VASTPRQSGNYLSAIIADLRRFDKTDRKFIPLPATYLRGNAGKRTTAAISEPRGNFGNSGMAMSGASAVRFLAYEFQVRARLAIPEFPNCHEGSADGGGRSSSQRLPRR